ncbi:MAG: hypothetical protein ACREA3_00965, partial [Nitrosotalea sp.]
NRKAISAVLTTLIILVASVVLGTGVVLYGTSLFQTNAQSQAIVTTGIQVWIDKGGSGWAWGAADVSNDGDKLLSVNQISIRGSSVPFSNWYADTSITRVTTANFQAALNYTTLLVPGTTSDGGIVNGTGENAGATFTGCSGSTHLAMQLVMPVNAAPSLCMSQQIGPISLQPGAKAIVYFKIPQNTLTSIDGGSSASVGIYAGQVGSPVTVSIAAK